MLQTLRDNLESFEAINQDDMTRDLVLRMSALSQAGKLARFCSSSPMTQISTTRRRARSPRSRATPNSCSRWRTTSTAPRSCTSGAAAKRDQPSSWKAVSTRGCYAATAAPCSSSGQERSRQPLPACSSTGGVPYSRASSLSRVAASTSSPARRCGRKPRPQRADALDVRLLHSLRGLLESPCPRARSANVPHVVDL